MSDATSDETPSSPAPSGPGATVTPLRPPTPVPPSPRSVPAIVSFDRRELSAILNVYGRQVVSGEWRDYAIDCLKDRAVFSIFRRTSEMPLYRIEKNPKLARRQGAYSVLAPGGRIVKRGHELSQVLKVLEKGPKLVSVV
ncbi:MAG: DUF2794 domain-containing protein [Pseudomonadota bacterium]